MFTSGSVKAHENKLLQACQRFYRPLLTWSMSHRLLVVCAAGAVFVFSILLLSRLGTEFMPSLDEGDVAMHALRIPGTSLSQSVEMQYALEREIAKIPEVQTIFAKIGTAEIATDPVPPSVADNFIMQSGMDLFHAGFSNDLGPVRVLRNIGLMAAERAGVLKRQALKYALGL